MTTRKSNFELLRIVSIILITFHHFAIYTNFNFPSSITLPQIYVQFISSGAKIGVNIFVLISGFFLAESKRVKIEKVVSMWLQCLFYSTTISVILIVAGVIPFSINTLVSSFFPITFNLWWFFPAYFVLYCLYPFINTCLEQLHQKQHITLIMFLTVIWCVIPTIFAKSIQCNDFLWFLYLYILAVYIRRYINFAQFRMQKIGLFFIMIGALLFATTIIFYFLGTRYSFFATHSMFLYDMNRMPVLVLSVIVFFIFAKLQVKRNHIINTFAATALGVYLIQDYPLLRDYV